MSLSLESLTAPMPLTGPEVNVLYLYYIKVLYLLEKEYKLLQKAFTPAMRILHIVLQSKVFVQDMHACMHAGLQERD